MSTFSDQWLFRFLEDTFVEDLLINQLGLPALFNLIYTTEDIDVKQIALTSIQRKEFAAPIFETIRTSGLDEQIMPTAERVKVDRAQPRHGRLSWIDVSLDIVVATSAELKTTAIERVTARNLLDKLGGVTSIPDLKKGLAALYPPSVVDAFFERFRITSIDDFKSNPMLFLEFVFKAPPPFDPVDPANATDFSLNVCFQFQTEFKITEGLQNAKLCRSILENERDYSQKFAGGEIDRPYAFVVIFPDSVVVDNAIPNLTAAQIKASAKDLFLGERMLAHFA